MESEHRIVEVHVKMFDANRNPVPASDWDIFNTSTAELFIQIRGPVNAPPPAAEPKEPALYVVVDRDGNLRGRMDFNPHHRLFTLEQARAYCERDRVGPHSIIPLAFFLEEIREVPVSKLIAARFAAKQAEDV